MTQYNPHNIDKTLKRMEDADELKAIHRSGTNIMSFFDDNDKEHELKKQQSQAEAQKDEYLKSVELLKSLIQEKGTNKDLNHVIAVGLLIETTDFLNIPPDRKKMLKEKKVKKETLDSKLAEIDKIYIDNRSLKVNLLILIGTFTKYPRAHLKKLIKK